MTARRNGHVLAPAEGSIREDAAAFLTSGGTAAPSPASPKPASILRRV